MFFTAVQRRQLSNAPVKTNSFRILFKTEITDAHIPFKFDENWPHTSVSCLKSPFIELPEVALHTIGVSYQTYCVQLHILLFWGENKESAFLTQSYWHGKVAQTFWKVLQSFPYLSLSLWSVAPPFSYLCWLHQQDTEGSLSVVLSFYHLNSTSSHIHYFIQKNPQTELL